MAGNSLVIMLDNASGTFVSENKDGHNNSLEVTGWVVVNMAKTKEIEGVKLRFKGMAFVLWSQTKSLRRSVTYSTFEVFCNQTVWLAGAKGEKIVFPSGETSYPFSLTLPPNLPSSCKEQYGKITYEVTAAVRRPWKAHLKASKALKVVAPALDIRRISPKVMMPVQETATKGFSNFGCCSGLLKVELSLPSRGVVIGQPFSITVTLENNSDVDVHEVVGELKKYTTCRLQPPKKRTMLTKKTLSICKLGPTARKSSACKTVALPTPSESPINVDACSILDIEYYVVVTAITSGVHANLKLKTPVRFGVSGGHSQFTNAGFESDSGLAFDDFQ